MAYPSHLHDSAETVEPRPPVVLAQLPRIASRTTPSASARQYNAPPAATAAGPPAAVAPAFGRTDSQVTHSARTAAPAGQRQFADRPHHESATTSAPFDAADFGDRQEHRGHWGATLTNWEKQVAPFAGVIVSLALIAAAGLLYWLVAGGPKQRTELHEYDHQAMQYPAPPDYHLTPNTSLGPTSPPADALSEAEDISPAENQPLVAWKRSTPHHTAEPSAPAGNSGRSPFVGSYSTAVQSAGISSQPESGDGDVVAPPAHPADTNTDSELDQLRFPQTATPDSLDFGVLGVEMPPTADDRSQPQALPEVPTSTTPSATQPLLR